MGFKNLTPIKRVSSFQEVTYRFEELLRTGSLKPGEKLPPENELARAFQVSRPTLREALKALNVLGLLVSRTGDGTYVGEGSRNLFKTAIYFSTFLSAVDFVGLIEARVAIEPFLAEMAALRATPRDLDQMKQHLREMKEGLGQMEKYVQAEVAFHDAIIKAARSTVLQGIMESLRDLLLEGRTKITGDQTGKKNLDFHTSIYEAIRARNPDLARRRMRAHVRDSRKRYEMFYQKLKVSSIVPSRQLAGAAWQTGEDSDEQRHPSSARRSRSN